MRLTVVSSTMDDDDLWGPPLGNLVESNQLCSLSYFYCLFVCSVTDAKLLFFLF